MKGGYTIYDLCGELFTHGLTAAAIFVYNITYLFPVTSQIMVDHNYLTHDVSTSHKIFIVAVTCAASPVSIFGADVTLL